MGFIKSKAIFEKGDKVVLVKNVEVMAGTFEKGTEMTIIRYSGRGWDLVDKDGNRLLECSATSFEKVDVLVEEEDLSNVEYGHHWYGEYAELED